MKRDAPKFQKLLRNQYVECVQVLGGVFFFFWIVCDTGRNSNENIADVGVHFRNVWVASTSVNLHVRHIVYICLFLS